MMSQLISRQFDVLQGIGLTPGAAPAGTVTPAAVIIPAPAAPAAVPTAAAAEQPVEAPQPSRFAVFNPREAASNKGLTPEQQAHVNDLTARYNRKTLGSKNYTEQHRSALADRVPRPGSARNGKSWSTRS